MFFFRRPTDTAITAFVTDRQDSKFSYTDVGLSRSGQSPSGYNADRYRVKLGSGPAAFRRGVELLRSWKMFDIDWVYLGWRNTPIETGRVVGVLASHFGFWSLNACRIVYVIDDHDTDYVRFGFAYGTLLDHAERGEERFMIELDRRTDEVSYDLFAFSQPSQWMTRLGYPLARRLQRRFGRDSQNAMVDGMTR